jgi:ATP-dependent exoDNAse (exonuclease V) beta subunit
MQLELSRVQTALRLSARPSELHLLREHPFAYVREVGGSNELVPGILDRAVISRAQRRAEIVDFKSDEIAANDEAALRARAESYRGQLESYRAALSRLEDLDPSRVSMRVCFVAAGRTLEL